MGLEVISVVGRRRRWPHEKKLEVLMEALAPGASVAAVADRHGVARNLVYTWLRSAREGRLDGVVPARPTTPTLVCVEVAPTVSTGAVPPLTAPQPSTVTTPAIAERAMPAAPPRRRGGSVEIRLANGRVVKVDEGIDPAALGAIVAALDGGCG
jgi:transposase